MRSLLWFLLGFLSAWAAGLALLIMGTSGFSALSSPSGLERWVATRIRTAAIPSDARGLSNPVADSAEVEAEARAHWADHCAFCHAADGSGSTPPGQRTWPPAPDMRQPGTQRATDGELFYVIQNGVRFTAMPAWSTGSAHDAEDSWKLVRFIRHLPSLTAAEKAEIQNLTPKTPDEIKEEEDEKKFLEGETDELQTRPHHH